MSEKVAVVVNEMMVAVGPYISNITEADSAEIMWQLVGIWSGKHQGAPLRLLDYDDMLMPDLGYKFTTLPKAVFVDLQAKARKLLISNADPSLPREIVEHWQKISAGVVPFGYVLSE